MKRIIIFALALAVLGCARKEKKEIERLTLVKDSIYAEAQIKEQAINEFITSFNQIEENLKQIKEKENLITVTTKQGQELNQEVKDRINQDINLIYEMMLKNKKAVASLSKKLKLANAKIDELEKMIANLNDQIAQKDAEISDLKNRLESMNIQITELTSTLDTVTADNKRKGKLIEEQTETINTGFYVFGTQKELMANKIITKEGGFIGIGKIAKLKQDFNTEYFTKVDIRKMKSFQLKAKKAKILTTHPSDSYKLYSTEKTADSLVVINPTTFWSASKYLVIVVE